MMGLEAKKARGPIFWDLHGDRDAIRRQAGKVRGSGEAKNALARKRRRLWTQRGEDAPVKVRELTRGWEW